MSDEFIFGEFRLDAGEECLYKAGEEVSLSRRTVQVLHLLVKNSGKIVTKQEFFDSIWADSFVEEGNLPVAIAALRKALGDDPKQPRFIVNLPRRGYRFIADVRRIEANGSGVHSAKAGEGFDEAALGHSPTVEPNALGETNPPPQKRFALRHKVAIAAASVLLVFAATGIGYQNFASRGHKDLSIPDDLAAGLSEKDRAYIVAHGTRDREAYLHYLKGRYYWERRKESIGDSYYDKAVDEYKQAIDLDPTFALPYAAIADALSQMSAKSRYILPNDERYRVITAYLRKAIEIDPTLSEAHASLGMNELFLAPKPQWTIAGQEYRKAVELDPANAQARHWLAEYLAITGKFDQSLAEYEKAIELDPLSMAARGDKCYALMFARRNDDAIRCINEVLRLDPNFERTYWYAFVIHLSADKPQEALAVWPRADTDGIPKDLKPKLLAALNSGGKEGFWRTFYDLCKDLGGPGAPMALARLGERDAAFAAIEKWIAAEGGSVPYIKVWPLFDGLYDDPRWNELVARVAPEG
ncbi:MAG: winged helix-turn-helix domain-containing protein [Acidobacteria bacterium]|nr:winged helix-turn-helix domain-containing protein [Acidobacteriota bacterium]